MLNASPAGISASTPDPALRPGVGIAVLVRRADGAILMGQRQGSHGAGTWSVPGGHVEQGETLWGAAVRELAEEAGIRIDSGDVEMLDEYTFTDFPGGRSYVTLYAVVTVPAETGLPEPCREMSAWIWADSRYNVPGDLFAPLDKLITSKCVDPWDEDLYPQ